MPGKFLIFDGGEGAGKSLMARKVRDVLMQEGLSIVLTREPGGSVYAEEIRKLILNNKAGAALADAETMFALFWSARRDHVVNTILPALKKGSHVICDRFDSSTWAYQIRGQQQEQLRQLFWAIREHYLANALPDCYIIFDVAPEIGFARVIGRQGKMTHFDERDLEFHARVREGFLEFTRSNRGISHRLINANLPKEEVQERMLLFVRELLA